MAKAEKKTKKKNPEVKAGKLSKPKDKVKKGRKAKEKMEIQPMPIPRFRLEPRIQSPEKNKSLKERIMNIERDRRLVVLLNVNEVNDYLKKRFSKEKVYSPEKSHSSMKNEQTDASDSESDVDDARCNSYFESFAMQKRKRTLFTKNKRWKDKEIKDLAYSLQTHGFADLKKVAECVKSRTDNEINAFTKRRAHDLHLRKDTVLIPVDDEEKRPPGRPPNRWSTVSHERLGTWPNVRKWRRLAFEQIVKYIRVKDYSKPVMLDLCKKCYEEESEPVDSQVINTKAIYKYLLDCMSGCIPAQLPPKESALVLDMLREVRMIPIAYDFEEERKFIQEFKAATKFKPFEVKDEFRKNMKRAPVEYGLNTVSVPEEIFLDLSRHKRILQCFNPLITPVWMLQKEQEFLRQYFEESNVYVD